jgi:hypothetical protein
MVLLDNSNFRMSKGNWVQEHSLGLKVHHLSNQSVKLQWWAILTVWAVRLQLNGSVIKILTVTTTPRVCSTNHNLTMSNSTKLLERRKMSSVRFSSKRLLRKNRSATERQKCLKVT